MSVTEQDPDLWRKELRNRGVDEAAIGRLDVFIGVQERFGAAVDLTGPAARARAGRMVLESVAAEVAIPVGARVLDVGSGNGFPIVPLLVVRPDLQGVLLEPRERRWAFLREVVRTLSLGALVERSRIEEYRETGFDVLTVRALAPRVWEPEAVRVLGGSGTVCWWAPDGAAEERRVAGAAPVLTLPLLKGRIVVWRLCST